MDDQLTNLLYNVEPHMDVALSVALAILLESGEPEWVSADALILAGSWIATRLIEGPQFEIGPEARPMGLPWLERMMGEDAAFHQTLLRDWRDDPRFAYAWKALMVLATILASEPKEVDAWGFHHVGELVGETGRQVFEATRGSDPEVTEDWFAALKFADDWFSEARFV